MNKSKLVIFVVLFVLIAAAVFFGFLSDRSNEIIGNEELMTSADEIVAEEAPEEIEQSKAVAGDIDVEAAEEEAGEAEIAANTEEQNESLETVSLDAGEGVSTDAVDVSPEPSKALTMGDNEPFTGTVSELDITLPFLSERSHRMPLIYTCYQNNVSPPLSWSDVPEGTQSFVIMMEKIEDEDSPFVNWLAYNIPSDARNVGRAFSGYTKEMWVTGENDHQNTGYVGPCDPKGKIPYRISVYALNIVLDVEAGANSTVVKEAMSDHIMAKGHKSFHHYYRL